MTNIELQRFFRRSWLALGLISQGFLLSAHAQTEEPVLN